MNALYRVLDDIRDHFLGDGMTQSVRFDSVETVGDDKNTTFSQVVVDLSSATPLNGSISLSLSLVAVDVIDVNKVKDSTDEFYGGDNYIDVLQSQMNVLTKFYNALRSGALSTDYELQGQPVMTPFKDNYIGGYIMNVNVVIPNETSAC